MFYKGAVNTELVDTDHYSERIFLLTGGYFQSSSCREIKYYLIRECQSFTLFYLFYIVKFLVKKYNQTD